MKRLSAVIALITTLIGSADLCVAGELKITEKASDWLKAAKLPSHEIKEGPSFSQLTEEERKDLLLAAAYIKGYTHGILTGGHTAVLWGVDSAKVTKYIRECRFVKSPGDAYDSVRDYLIANPSARNHSTWLAFQRTFHAACGIKNG